MWEISQLSLLQIPLRTNVKAEIRFRNQLSNQGKFTNFPFDIGWHYPFS
jgi:hypothetical protein